MEKINTSMHADGYANVLNKYGTPQDNSEAYTYECEPIVPDMQLTELYEGNGLFSKIIDTPAEEALKHGFSLNIGDSGAEEYVLEVLDSLDFEETASTAVKWSRLYGGAVVVMLIDDGGGLEDPLDYDNIRGIDELAVFERAVVQPDYISTYMLGMDKGAVRFSHFGEPEFYFINGRFGSFRVHESRCLVFKNGVLPSQTSNSLYQTWGMPEYIKIRRALRETTTAHSDAVKLLERSVQAIYSMKNLAQLLATDDGETQVLKRLELIDMARGILNSIAIDAEGENYEFKTFQFSGVKDVIESSCNMLSALTNIPQTILFGRSPAGMNATGESDLENYYNFVERIQKLMLKKNLRRLVDVILASGVSAGKISGKPSYKIEFNPLWSMSETEQAAVEQTRAAAALTKAQTAQVYIDMQALDPSEVRKKLSSDGEYDIELSDEGDDDIYSALYGEEAEESTGNGLNSILESGIISTKANDGGEGSGRYPKGSGENNKTDPKAAKQFTEELKGTVAKNGVKFSAVSAHAAYQMKDRNIDTGTLREIITNPDFTYPGNKKHKYATCFQKSGKRIVYSNDGVVITAINLEGSNA